MSEINPDEAVARARRAKAFGRRSAAARTGLHLPSFPELLRLQPFCRENLQVDAAQFSERIMARLKPNSATSDLTRDALNALSVSPGIEDCLDAAIALRFSAEGDRRNQNSWEEGARRCEYYAAMRGDRASMWKIAGYAVDLAYDPKTPDDEAIVYGTAAIGWMLTATGKVEDWPMHWTPMHVRAHAMGHKMIDRFVEERARQVTESDKDREKAQPDSFGSKLLAMKGTLSEDLDKDDEEAVESTTGKIVVLKSVGNGEVSDGKRVAADFKSILNVLLPLVEVSKLSQVRLALEDEFPYARLIIDVILNDLSRTKYVEMRPTIFVGPPGGGKTSFARCLLDLLQVPYEVYNCGGIGDASLAGTARRWSTGEPSLPLSLMRRHLCASPGVILDEVEKAGTSRTNGALTDALLGLLEPTSAEVWHDPYIQSAVDMSHVVWIGTANSMDGIPAPLRDRCRRLVFPTPGPEHLVPLANNILRTLLDERGLNPLWAFPFDVIELDALRSAWPGGSIRKLQQLVDAVLKVRDKFNSTH